MLRSRTGSAGGGARRCADRDAGVHPLVAAVRDAIKCRQVAGRLGRRGAAGNVPGTHHRLRGQSAAAEAACSEQSCVL